MKPYLDLLSRVICNGSPRSDRTQTGTLSTFGEQLRIDLSEGFPLLTTKRVFWRGVVVELLWFLRGRTDVKFLQERGVHIWDEWADSSGDLGPVYGKQWRSWKTATIPPGTGEISLGQVDQLQNLVQCINQDPFGRRHIVSAWNVADIPQMKLPPCHTLFQCYVEEGVINAVRLSSNRYLSLHLYARSIDIFLGLPFNIASYALLLSIIATKTSMLPGQLIISFGDLHLYNTHMDQARIQLARAPRTLPTLNLSNTIHGKAFEETEESDITLEGYQPHPTIAAPVAV